MLLLSPWVWIVYYCFCYGIRNGNHARILPSPASFANVRLRHMLIGYARVSKADGSQPLDLQRDALIAAGVDARQIYSDRASGKNDERPGLEACLKALREGDVLVVWKLDRLGRSLHHLVKTVTMLCDRSIGLKVITGQGAAIDTTTAAGRLSFGIFAALAEFESELIRERTMAGLQAARARAQRRAHTIPDKGPGSHDPGGHGAPGHIGLGTVQGARDHARHPLPLCRPARKPSGPWQTGDRGLECHLALSRNRPGIGREARSAGVPGLAAGGDAKEPRGRKTGGGARCARRRLSPGAAGSGDGRLAGCLRHSGLSPRLEGGLDVLLRNGNGGAMPVWRAPEIDHFEHRNQRRHTPKIIPPRIGKTTIWNSSHQRE